jgi:hypothetical protein
VKIRRWASLVFNADTGVFNVFDMRRFFDGVVVVVVVGLTNGVALELQCYGWSGLPIVVGVEPKQKEWDDRIHYFHNIIYPTHGRLD